MVVALAPVGWLNAPRLCPAEVSGVHEQQLVPLHQPAAQRWVLRMPGQAFDPGELPCFDLSASHSALARRVVPCPLTIPTETLPPAKHPTPLAATPRHPLAIIPHDGVLLRARMHVMHVHACRARGVVGLPLRQHHLAGEPLATAGAATRPTPQLRRLWHHVSTHRHHLPPGPGPQQELRAGFRHLRRRQPGACAKYRIRR